MASTEQLNPATIRSDTAAEPLNQLRALVLSYRTLPAPERAARLDRDAERITGDIARHLTAAREKLARVPAPRQPHDAPR
jgi:hypothetical protein